VIAATFPTLQTSGSWRFGALDPERVVTLLRAADAAAFFTREEPRREATELDVRTWHVRLCHGGSARLLAFPEPLPDFATEVLIRLARDCLSARRVCDTTRISGRVAGHAGGPVRVTRTGRCDRLFDRSEPAPAGPSGRIFHLAITAGNRSRELAINDPLEHPNSPI
jgi:hypothetical protein